MNFERMMDKSGSMLIDSDAPILPGVSAGGVELGKHIRAIYRPLWSFIANDDGRYWMTCPFTIRYEKGKEAFVEVNLLSGKVTKVGVGRAYRGDLPNGFKRGKKTGAKVSI